MPESDTFDDAGRAIQRIVSHWQGEAAEQRQELLDSLENADFPRHEQERRAAQFELLRAVHAAVSGLHIVTGHGLETVMTQIARGTAHATGDLLRPTQSLGCGHCGCTADASPKSPVLVPPCRISDAADQMRNGSPLFPMVKLTVSSPLLWGRA